MHIDLPCPLATNLILSMLAELVQYVNKILTVMSNVGITMSRYLTIAYIIYAYNTIDTNNENIAFAELNACDKIPLEGEKRILDMFRKITNLYTGAMLRQIIYKTLVRLIAGLSSALLWNRFANASSRFTLFGDMFFAVGVILLGLAWFNYLKLDGIKVRYTYEGRKPSKNSRHAKAASDYVDQEVTPGAEPGDNKPLTAALCANLLSGACFLVPAAIYNICR